jgi:hypothetical protein
MARVWCLLPIPKERNEAHQGNRGVHSLQCRHQLPSLPTAIRARGVGPGLGQGVPT